MVDQPCFERLGEQLQVGFLGDVDQFVELLVAEQAFADIAHLLMQALVLEQVIGLADALVELARVGQVGVGQACLQGWFFLEGGIQPCCAGADDQQAHEGLPDFFPTHLGGSLLFAVWVMQKRRQSLPPIGLWGNCELKPRNADE